MAFELLETIVVGALGCNCSLLACSESKEAIIVDPGDEARRIIDMVNSYGVSVKALLHTHAHFDHIGATRELKEEFGAEICLHSGDQWLYDNITMQGNLFGWELEQTLPVDRYLEDRETFEFGKTFVDVLHTPGHTPGSICFHAKEKSSVLFSGDTLFSAGIGRTDLWGGSFPQIISSIKSKLLTLDPDTTVIAGHGPSTKIGWESKHNPFVS